MARRARRIRVLEAFVPMWARPQHRDHRDTKVPPHIINSDDRVVEGV